MIHHAVLRTGLSTEEASSKYGRPILLVPYRGVAKKRFVGQMLGGPGTSFLFSPKGFGIGGFLIGKDSPFYAADSVLIFLAYLTRLYMPLHIKASNISYAEGLKAIMNECAGAYMFDKISMTNQEELAVAYVEQHLFKM